MFSDTVFNIYYNIKTQINGLKLNDTIQTNYEQIGSTWLDELLLLLPSQSPDPGELIILARFRFTLTPVNPVSGSQRANPPTPPPIPSNGFIQIGLAFFYK